jgi:uncharacterized protein YpbB
MERPRSRSGKPPSAEKRQAMDLLRQGTPVEVVARETGRTVSTVNGYLLELIAEDQPVALDAWLDPHVYELVSRTIDRLQASALKPVFVELGEKIPYDQIRLVMAHKASSGFRFLGIHANRPSTAPAGERLTANDQRLLPR